MIALVFMAITCVGIAAAASTNTSSDHRVIYSSDTGNVIGTPDRAQITFSADTENADVQISPQDSAQMMTKVIDSLVAIGIPHDALKISGYGIHTVYDDTIKSILDQKVRAYRVTNTLKVTLHDVNLKGSAIDVAVAYSINQAILFLLSEEQSQVFSTEALKEVARSRADADTGAGAIGNAVMGVQSADT